MSRRPPQRRDSCSRTPSYQAARHASFTRTPRQGLSLPLPSVGFLHRSKTNSHGQLESQAFFFEIVPDTGCLVSVPFLTAWETPLPSSSEGPPRGRHLCCQARGKQVGWGDARRCQPACARLGQGLRCVWRVLRVRSSPRHACARAHTHTHTHTLAALLEGQVTGLQTARSRPEHGRFGGELVFGSQSAE